jgi:hypothetical protein
MCRKAQQEIQKHFPPTCVCAYVRVRVFVQNPPATAFAATVVAAAGIETVTVVLFSQVGWLVGASRHSGASPCGLLCSAAFSETKT